MNFFNKLFLISVLTMLKAMVSLLKTSSPETSRRDGYFSKISFKFFFIFLIRLYKMLSSAPYCCFKSDLSWVFWICKCWYNWVSDSYISIMLLFIAYFKVSWGFMIISFIFVTIYYNNTSKPSSLCMKGRE